MNLPKQLSVIANEMKLVALELKDEMIIWPEARARMAKQLNKSATKLEKIVLSTSSKAKLCSPPNPLTSALPPQQSTAGELSKSITSQEIP